MSAQETAAAAPPRPQVGPDFRFGVATSAYQIEGAVREDGRGESNWDRFVHTEGHVVNGETGDVACDHYHRWREDLDLIAALRIESYRFSIAWPRIQPEGSGPPLRKGLDFYRALVEGMLERGIEPTATLFHWDLPQALEERGGWAARETAERFADYAAIVAAELGDVVERFITINEPWVVSFLGYQEGRKAPGIRDWPTALRASHHVQLAHGLGMAALRAAAGRPLLVGPALNLSPIHPVDASSEADREAARRQDGYLNRWFLDPLLRGAYPQDMVRLYERAYGAFDVVRPGDLETIAAPIDFLGVNYYNPMRARALPGSAPLELELVDGRPPLTSMGWEVDPDGLRQTLTRLRDEYAAPPICITENGAAYPDGDDPIEDAERTDYLERHLAALHATIADGVDVRRYFLWSLLDNFEWEHGYAQRFGIVHVDFETQARTPKRSALMYSDHIARTRGEA